MPSVLTATASAPINIAVLEYWGKRNLELNLPCNDSISVSLDGVAHKLGTKTTVTMTEASETSFTVTINGQDFTRGIDAKARKILKALLGLGNCPKDYNVKIESENYSPTAAGLASSASGYAALTMAMAECLGLSALDKTVLSRIARLGSGSACRSLYGGFVHWSKGNLMDGSDSHATQLFPESHWPELACLIIRLPYEEKSVSSTEGMKRTINTSELSKFRYGDHYMSGKVQKFRKAIEAKDFEAFGELTMRDSNQFHAICMDSFPPIRYLQEESWDVISLVHQLNTANGRIVAAYTFDAGPHPVIFALRQDIPQLRQHLHRYEKCFIECKIAS